MRKIKKSAAESLMNNLPVQQDWECSSGDECYIYSHITNWQTASFRPVMVDDETKPIYEEVAKLQSETVIEEATHDEEGNELTPAVVEVTEYCPMGSEEVDGVCRVLVGYEQKAKTADDVTKPIYEEVPMVEEVVTLEEATYDDQGNELTPVVTETQYHCPSGSEEVDGVCLLLTGYEQVAIMELFEDPAKVEALAVKQAKDQEINDKINQGRADRLKCEAALDLVAGYNRSNALTIEQINQMQQTFAQAESLLRAGRPDFAAQVITLIEPDGVLITQEMKDNVLELLA
jgi:hypothetical protein